MPGGWNVEMDVLNGKDGGQEYIADCRYCRGEAPGFMAA